LSFDREIIYEFIFGDGVILICNQLGR